MERTMQNKTTAESKGGGKTAKRASATELVWVFAIGCFVGCVVETIFCFIFKGYWESRRAMVIGPFNQVYGFGGVFMTLCLAPFMHKSWKYQLGVGMLAGGALEVVLSLLEQYVLGTRSWEYSWMPLSFFGGRTNLLYMFFFGVMGVVFIRFAFPHLRQWVGSLSHLWRRVGTLAVAVFFTVNLALSGLAIWRWGERQSGEQPSNATEQWLDARFPDEVMREIYPVMEFV